MQLVKNANKVAAGLNNRGRKLSAASRQLLKTKVGDGFTTLKSKVPGLRVFATKNKIKMSARAMGYGSYLIIRK